MPLTPGTNRELPVVLELHLQDGLLAMALGISVSLLASISAALKVMGLPISKALRTMS